MRGLKIPVSTVVQSTYSPGWNGTCGVLHQLGQTGLAEWLLLTDLKNHHCALGSFMQLNTALMKSSQ